MATKKPKTPEQIIREHFSKLGKQGIAAKLEKYGPEERSEQQRKAALKRWRAHRKKKAEKNS